MPPLTYLTIRPGPPRPLRARSKSEDAPLLAAPVVKRRCIAPDERLGAHTKAATSVLMPPELWALVFSALAKHDVVFGAGQTCRLWRAVAHERCVLGPRLWHKAGPAPRLALGDVHRQALCEAQLLRAVQRTPRRLLPAAGPLRAAAFSADSHHAIVVNHAGYVGWQSIVRRPESHAVAPWYGLMAPTAVHAAAFCPTGRMVALASDEDVCILWRDRVSPKLGRVGSAPSQACFSATFAPGGTHLATGTTSNAVALWPLADLKTPSAVLAAPRMRHPSYVAQCLWSQNGTTIAGLTAYGVIVLWNAQLPQTMPRILPTSNASIIALSRDARWLAAGYARGRVRLFCVADNARVGPTWRMGRDRVQALAFSPDDSLLAIGHRRGSVCVWPWQQAKSAQRTSQLLGHDNAVRAVAFNADQSLVLSAAEDGEARLWPVPQFGRAG